jgi:hypothetical protein
MNRFCAMVIVMLTAVSAQGSILFEDNFESGLFDPKWSVSLGGASGLAVVDMIHSQSSAHGGEYHARSRNGNSSVRPGTMIALIDNHTFDPTVPYEVSAYIGFPQDISPQVIVALQVEGTYNWVRAASSVLAYSSDGASDYQKVTATFDIHFDPLVNNWNAYAGKAISVLIETGRGPDNRWNYAPAYIDDVQLAIPEPATGVLLLATWVLWRRRVALDCPN